MTDFEHPPTTSSMCEEEIPDMTFSSSPVLYPASSSPVLPPVLAHKQKRKLFQSLNAHQPVLKRPRLTPEIVDPDCTGETGFVSTQVEDDLIPVQNVEKDVEATHRPDSEPVTEVVDIDEIAPEVSLPVSLPASFGRGLTRRTIEVQTTSGRALKIVPRKKQAAQSYEHLISDRSKTSDGKAERSYYGIDIHKLVDDAKIQAELDAAAKEVEAQNALHPSIEPPQSSRCDGTYKSGKHQMWTEKYRAKKFTELVGDERTHRSVLRWLKAWDSIVFPGMAKMKAKRIFEEKDAPHEQQHRKIMLLTGPPGLGKTTLAHVCAKQAGYEVLEINASDDRSRDIVKGRIKDALATETVRGIQEPGKARKAGRPVCVVVDEVDGVVTGSSGGGGEGGFMKALIDLVQLDQRNCSFVDTQTGNKPERRKGDKFKLLRPLILICNDVYAPSLRPLRQSNMAEIVHVRKPALDKVVTRLKAVFEKENINCDNDAVRRLCEDTWGLGTRKQSSSGRGTGEGDIRGVLVQGEWMAHKLRANNGGNKLTRKWVESQINDSATKGQKGLGRGGVREIVERIFIEGAGLSNLPTTISADEARQYKEAKTNIGVTDLRKRAAVSALREMINTTGDHDRLMTDCFATYGTHVFQDDTFLSKPNASYDWLHFHDSLSSRIFSGQEWELNPYLSTSACAFHNLFSSVDKGASAWSNDREKEEGEEQVHPFSGAKADFVAYEAEKQNKTTLTELQGNFSGELLRLFSSTETIATELIPNVSRILAPDVKPVVVGGSGGNAAVASVRKESERNCINSSVQVMNALGIAFEKVRIENEGYGGNTTSGGFALRMEPPIDTLSTYHLTTGKSNSTATTTQPTRYAIRQVLDQELRKEKILRASLARNARGNGAPTASALETPLNNSRTDNSNDEKENHRTTPPTQKPAKIKRDFFGRAIVNNALPAPPPSVGSKIDAENIARSTATKGKARSGGSSIGRDEGDGEAGAGRIWMSFHEGFSNAVRKPITLGDLMDGF